MPVFPRALAGALFRRSALALAASLVVPGFVPISAAHAQASAAGVQQVAVDIPPGPLGGALNRYARELGLTLSFDPAVVAGKTTAGLRGLHTVQAGFATLLAGSGLQAVPQGGGYGLRAVPASAADSAAGETPASLREIRVQGERESADGAVQGYRAERSASASKMDLPRVETPQTVSVIGAPQMRDQAVASVNEAVRYTAGVRAYDHGITDDDVAVRGFYLTGTGLYRDGMRLIQNGFMSNLEPYGLERLEVVHGPAAVMYGQSAPGGLINAVTKRPRAGMRQEVGVELGSHDRRQLTADIGGALNSSGTVLGRLTVLKREAGTQWRYLDDDRTYIAPALSLVGDRTRLTLLAQYQESRGGFITPYYRITPFGPSAADINVNGPGSFHEKRGATLGYLFEHSFNDALTLRHNLRYLDGKNTRHEMRNRGLAPDKRSITRLAMVRPDAEKTWVADTQLEARFNTGALKHQLVGGVDLYRSTLDWRIHSLNGRVANLDLIEPQYIEPAWGDTFLSDRALAKNAQVGFYLQDQIKFDERWVLSLGLRRDRARIDTTYDARATATAPFSQTRMRRTDSATTGRAGLVYLAPNGLAPYLSYSTAFQPPLSTSTDRDADGRPYQPETARQWEAGLRYAPTDAGYMLSAAVFDLRKQNVRTPNALDPRRETQTGEVRSRGLELQAEGDLGAGFSVIGAYTYLDAEITRSNRRHELGGRPAATPEHVASLWGKYKRQGWELGLGLRAISSAPGDLPQDGAATPRNDGYTLVDALVAYDQGPWRFALNVANLADRKYSTQCNVMRGGASFCARGFGRDVRVSAAYRF